MAKGLIAAGIVTVVLLGGTAAYVVNAKFTSEKFEKRVIAADESMQNTWAMMQNQLEMQGFTVENYGKTFIDTIKAQAIRYENDSGMMMKWVKENTAQMSPDTHLKFMDAINKAYVKKEMEQKSKISIVQEYRTYLDASVKGFVSKVVFDYPTDTTEAIMARIIKTKKVAQTWVTGNDETVNPFAK